MPYLHLVLEISIYLHSVITSNLYSNWTRWCDNCVKTGIFVEGTFWGNPGGKPANAYAIETTAYALLALLQFGDIKTSSSIVSWLTSQRDATGPFRTTQVTLIDIFIF
jgi:hypothetical protein